MQKLSDKPSKTGIVLHMPTVHLEEYLSEKKRGEKTGKKPEKKKEWR